MYLTGSKKLLNALQTIANYLISAEAFLIMQSSRMEINPLDVFFIKDKYLTKKAAFPRF